MFLFLLGFQTAFAVLSGGGSVYGRIIRLRTAVFGRSVAEAV